MSHRETKYNDPNPTINRINALADLEEWFGTKRFNNFAKDIKLSLQSDKPITRSQFEFACAIGGAEGFPVQCWADELGVPPYTEQEQAANDS